MQHARRGLTLVEVLVVIATIGVFLLLIFPGGMKVRAAAARAQCQNNLRQLGLAANDYASRHGYLPAGRATPAPTVFSAFAHLLPDLEQDALAKLIDSTKPPADYGVGAIRYDGSANFAAASTPLKVLLCPADPLGPRVPGSQYGATSYAGNAGSGAHGGSLYDADGVFYTGSQVKLTDITDGTSNTALFAERLLGDGPGGTDPQRGMIELAGNADTTPQSCIGAAANRQRGEKWIFGNYGNTLYNHALPPNAREPDCTNATQQRGRFTARSVHSSGVQVALCDGSVRFVRDAILPQTWAALSTRAGGETVSDDW